MKIVFLAPFGIRPKGTVLARMVPLAAELRQLGHDVVIIAPPYTNPEDSGKVETVRGVTIRNATLPRVAGPAGAPLLAWSLFRATLDERPDLVHLFKPKGYSGLAAMALIVLRRLGFRVPQVLVDTDDWEGRGGMNDLLPYSKAEKWFFAFQEQWLLRRAVGVTAASRALQTLCWATGVEPARLLYLPNGVSEAAKGDGASVRRKIGIAPDAPVLLLYTRFFEFSQEKLHFLCAEVCRRVPGVRILVAGKGKNKEEALLQQAGAEAGFADSLAMAGWIEPAEIPGFLAAGDVAIYPFSDTLVNRAKCPAKLTELLRAEKAVVADGVGQIAEYIRHGTSGILCDPDDWQEMADRVVELLLDPENGKALGREGRKSLLERFNWREFAIQLNGFYSRR